MLRNHGGFNTVRKSIISYYSSLPAGEVNEDQRQVVNYLKSRPITIFPYTFPEKYNAAKIQVHLDDLNQLHYVIEDKKRLYFKRGLSISDIKKSYNSLKIEQDRQSPHKYLSSGFSVENGSVVVDIGAAKGNFALSIIEKATMVYLFEAEIEWIEALNATFSPWRNKVKIINKYVGDRVEENCVSLDNYFLNGERIDFIKIDVEGAEPSVLNGALNLLKSSKSLKLSICTYHRQNDEKVITSLLQSEQFNVSHSRGYMIYFYDKYFEPPYLRHGLVRAEKK